MNRKAYTREECRLIGRSLSLTAGNLRDPAMQAQARVLAGEFIEAATAGGMHVLAGPVQWPSWLDGGAEHAPGENPRFRRLVDTLRSFDEEGE